MVDDERLRAHQLWRERARQCIPSDDEDYAHLFNERWRVRVLEARVPAEVGQHIINIADGLEDIALVKATSTRDERPASTHHMRTRSRTARA